MNSYFFSFRIPRAALLSAAPWLGLFGCFILFFLCFAAVHIAKLAKLGWKQTHARAKQEKAVKPTESDKKPQKPPTEEPRAPEPIYYIVERKQRRKKQATTSRSKFAFRLPSRPQKLRERIPASTILENAA